MQRLRNGSTSAILVSLLACFCSAAFAETNDPSPDPLYERDSEDEEREDAERRRFYAAAGMGFDFTRGDYGEPEDTDIYSASLFTKLEYEPITLKVLVPFVLIDGSENVIAGEGGQSTGGASNRRYGLGDVLVSLMYTWFPERRFVPILDFSTRLKIPTASEADSIGTGKLDTTLQVDVTEVLGPVSLFTGAGYRIKQGSQFRDIWLATAGASVRLGRPLSVGLAYDFRQGSTSRAGDAHELAPFASIRLGEHWSFGPYAVFGLSENSPDWGAGGSFGVSF